MRLSDPFHRGAFMHFAEKVLILKQVINERCFYVPGCNGVYADSVLRPLHCKIFCKLYQRCLGSPVKGTGTYMVQSRYRRIKNNSG